MPSSLPLPTIDELRKAFHDAVTGAKDNRADVRPGSIYDHFAGIGAISFSRAGHRDKDLFEAIYFDSAEGQELTDLIEGRYGETRVLSTYGKGTVRLSRPNTSGGAGTFWEGTRIRVRTAIGSRAYEVDADTAALATDSALVVPIRAVDSGTGTAINLPTQTGVAPLIEDPIWDTTWTVQGIVCADGTDFEDQDSYRSRLKTDRAAARVGYLKTILKACVDAGAANVTAYASNFPGDANDYGINVVYVADAGYSTPALMTARVTQAMESVRVLGCDLDVRGISPQRLSFSANVSLWDDPGRFDQVDLVTAMAYAISDKVNGKYDYRLSALEGAMRRATQNAIRSVAWTSPTTDAPLLSGSPPTFPATLTRYLSSPSDVSITLSGP